MKSNFLRPVMLLALALGLSACGGKATFEIKGTVWGLKYGNVRLTDRSNGEKIVVEPPTGTATTSSFRFPKTLEYGAVYDVAIVDETEDQPAHQDCQVLNGKETAGRLSEIDIVVRCTVDTHSVKGAINGDATGLVLVNGSEGKFTVPNSTTTSYAFPGIEYGKSYSIGILTPATSGKTCTLSGAPGGEMKDEDVVIDVTCV